MQQSYAAAHQPELRVGGLKSGMGSRVYVRQTNHKVFNAGKPLPKLSDVDDLKKALINLEIL